MVRHNGKHRDAERHAVSALVVSKEPRMDDRGRAVDAAREPETAGDAADAMPGGAAAADATAALGDADSDAAAAPSGAAVTSEDAADNAADAAQGDTAAAPSDTAAAQGDMKPDATLSSRSASNAVPPRVRNSRIVRFMSEGNQVKWVLAGKAALCGLVGGILVIVYRALLGWGGAVARGIFSYLGAHPAMIAVWVLAALGVGLLISWMVRKVPMGSGSGIPQVKGVLLNGLTMPALPVLGVRYLGGTLCSVFGLSLGREGPSIQIGAAGSQLVSQKIAHSKDEEKLLVAGGAAAGLSAAFNAPLSGMMFALEEMYRSFSPLVLLTAASASLTADIAAKYFFGLTPVLDFSTVRQISSLWTFLWMIPLGLLVGLVGALTNHMLLGAQMLYNKLPQWSRVPLSLLVALPVGLFFPWALGGGEQMIRMAENVMPSLSLLVLMVVVKMVFTSTSFGSGVPGGIFMPILAIGTACGGACGMALYKMGVIYLGDVTAFAIYGMAAALAASVKAPITAILLTVEMSGSLVHMLPVALCAFSALFVSDAIKTKPIYAELLSRYLASHGGAETEKRGNAIAEFPVEPGSKADGAMIASLDLPASGVLVTVIRGGREIIPYDSTRIAAGDYLVIVFPSVHMRSVHRRMNALCRGTVLRT